MQIINIFKAFLLSPSVINQIIEIHYIIVTAHKMLLLKIIASKLDFFNTYLIKKTLNVPHVFHYNN